MAVVLQFLSPVSDDKAVNVGLISRLMAVAGLALFAVTWRLWTPQDDFPQIPFLEAAASVPFWVDWVGCAIVVASLTFVLLVPNRTSARRIALAGFVLMTAGLILLDQHRLQPWAYQFVLIACVLCVSTDDKHTVTLLRLLVVGIYAHSALSKLDAGFLETHGQQLVEAVVGLFGMTLDGLEASTRRWLAFTLPAGEMLAAVGLCWKPTRKLAVVLSIVMHATLFLALGPWGMNHKPGVLIWNLFFVGQNLVLFWCRAGISETAEPVYQVSIASSVFGRLRNGIAAGIIFAAVLFPFLEPFGYCDHWPGWALYASKSERVSVFVHALHRNRLPREIRRFTDEAKTGPWCRVHLDRWSLETLDAPIYPEDRFRLAIANRIGNRYRLGDGVRAVVESSAHRRSGKRTSREISGTDALRRECRRFRLNTEPRRTGR